AQLLDEHLDDALADVAPLGRAAAGLHRDLRLLAAALDRDPVALGRLRRRRAEAEHAREEARLFLGGLLWVDVAHVVETAAAIAVLDGEAAAVERQADAAPGAVERLVDLERGPRTGDRARAR